MKKFILTFVIMLLIVLIPFISIIVYGEYQEDVYQNTYYAELKHKTELLETKEKKIVFIGGSSLSFGLRSDELEKALGYKVVNYGLYAALGTKPMMELALPDINEGDIVILAPELSSETYSLQFNYQILNKCLENCGYLRSRLSFNDQTELFFDRFSYILLKGSEPIEASAPYDLASFNEYGDIESDLVTNNILFDQYDSEQLIKPSAEMISDDFIKYVNQYKKKVEKKGASIYFTFSPTNRLSIVDDKLAEFNNKLKKIDIKILGSVSDFTYHQDYFYDTNYHLNYSGSLLHSKKMSDIIKRELNIENDYQIKVPDKPQPKYELSGDVTDSGCFTFNLVQGTYLLSGVKEEYKMERKLSIPEEVDGIPVTGILNKAFSDMPNLEVVILPNTIDQLGNDIFLGSPNVLKLYITNDSAPGIVGNGLLNGADSCKIYVKNSAYRSYLVGYTWINYKSYLVSYSEIGDE